MRDLLMLLAAMSASMACAVPTGQIAFMRSGSVWIVDPADGEARDLASAEYDRPLAWSPDGRHLLFWKHSDIGWDIWRCEADGSSPINLTKTTSGGCRSAAYSPDGSKIAFMRDSPPGMHVMDADGSNQRRLTDKGHRDSPPSWSRDGRLLAYVHLTAAGQNAVRAEVRVVDLVSGEDRLLVGGEGAADQPAFSPAGPRLVYQAVRDGNRDICVCDADGSTERNLTKSPETESFPAWSPDGVWIAFLSRSENGRTSLRVMKSDGSESRGVASIQGRAWPPAWSPDGRTLAFTSGEGEEAGLFIVEPGGGEPRRIASGRIVCPAWRPTAAGAAR